MTDETCRWPFGHPNEKDFYFCGRKPLEKFPYCKLHVLYAFHPKNAKDEDIITDDGFALRCEQYVYSTCPDWCTSVCIGLSSFERNNEMRDKIFIIPPNRVRYLSEISESNRSYDH